MASTTVNLNFWNDYVPSHAYAKETPFNHLDSTSSESTFPCILAFTIAIAQIFAGRKKMGKAQHLSAHSAPQPSHPINPSNSHGSPSKVSSTPRRTILRRHMPLEELNPCVLWFFSSVHSPCYSFAISATHPGHSTPLRRWREEQDTLE